MHAKQKNRRWLLIALLAGAAVLVALLTAAVVWLLRTPRAMDKNMPSAQPPAGRLCGLWLTQETPTAAGVMSASNPEALDTLFSGAAEYAVSHGMNALFVDVAGSGLTGVAFRDRVYETWPGACEADTFTKQYDPLRALCETASAHGLSVYAVTPALSDNADWDKALERLRSRYAVAGVWTHGETLFEEKGHPVWIAGASAFLDPSSLFLAAIEGETAEGVVFDYTQCIARPEALSLLVSALDDSAKRPELLNHYVPVPTLSISYPADGASIYTDKCFVMGTSDPAQPLYLNGQLVETRAPGGTFGVLADVDGETVYTVSQGSQMAAVTVNNGASGTGSGGGSSGGGGGHDSTQSVAPGTRIRTTGWITSLLYNPSSDGNINETVRAGATATVVDCTETYRSGRRTWAYQLASGDYVLAYNTELAGDAPMTFTGASAVPTETGETLTFLGSGTPLAYSNIVDGRLEMDFYDAEISPDFSVTGSQMVSGVTVTPGEACTRVTLTFSEPIWGHTIEYAEGTVQVLLKKTPVRSDILGKPLTGVRVLLDAGHGDHDNGAMGAAGLEAPVEKDVNLAVTLAVKYRLEQLGATVDTIRTDDSFLSLQDRNRAISECQPDFFIAIHHNSINLDVDANGQTGTECYYFYSAGKPLAETLVRNVTAAVNRPSRGAMWGYYYVTRNTTCPAVLLEIGFMVNPTEYEQITSSPVIWREAEAISMSILSCVPETR